MLSNEEIIKWAEDIVTGGRMGSKINNEKLLILINLAKIGLNPITVTKLIPYKWKPEIYKEYNAFYFDVNDKTLGPFYNENEAIQESYKHIIY